MPKKAFALVAFYTTWRYIVMSVHQFKTAFESQIHFTFRMYKSITRTADAIAECGHIFQRHRFKAYAYCICPRIADVQCVHCAMCIYNIAICQIAIRFGVSRRGRKRGIQGQRAQNDIVLYLMCVRVCVCERVSVA